MLNRYNQTTIKFKREWRLSLFLVFLLSACNDPSDTNSLTGKFNYSGLVMGTSFTIKVEVLPETIDAERLKNDIRHCLDEVDNHMSTYREDSELSKFNRNKSTDWQPVTRFLYFVIQKAQQISRLTDGAFDITVGPLVNLWGFGPRSTNFQVPGDLQIIQRLNQIGYQSLMLVDVPMAIKKLKPDIYIDLSALAKGFAVDQIAELLQAQGISDYMVEVGGELRLKGKKAEGGLWQIAIEKPSAEQRALHKVLTISDISIATSGDYRNFFDSEGITFSHTIDPRTGRPVSHKLASVTVLGETTMEADAWATALMVMGPEEGYNLAQQQNIAAFFIVKSDSGFAEQSTSAFMNYTR